jgi:hypothetical protein
MRPAAVRRFRAAAKGVRPIAWMSRFGRDARVAVAGNAPVARISIGVATMRKLKATEKLSQTPTSFWGVSPLPVPSSAGDNRPYISNLAGQLADTPHFACFAGSILHAGGIT